MSKRRYNLIAAGVLILGVAFMVIGFHRSEVQVIWQKSIRICLECIGIG